MDPFLLIFIGGGFIAFLLLIIGGIVSIRSERIIVDKRLGQYIEEETDLERASLQKERSSPVGEWLNNILEGSNWGARQARELARADLKLKPAEYLALMVIVGLGTAAVTWFITDQGNRIPIFSMIGFVIGLFLPRLYVRRLQGQRLQRFNDQLADMLNLMVNGLRAGYSTMQAMEAVSNEMPEPINMEFRRVIQEMQLGIPMYTALDNLLRRIPSDDLDLVITAMNVQREVGGNLAEILDTISFTIRERVRIKGEIRVLTSQVMYSGRFLAMMPLLIFAALWLMNKDYMMQFFIPETRLFGIIALVIGGSMIIAGYFVMTRIAKIEV